MWTLRLVAEGVGVGFDITDTETGKLFRPVRTSSLAC